MTNRNQKLLSSIDSKSRKDILDSVAKHYGITPEEALVEVTNEDAEDLLEYLVEPCRSAVLTLIQRHGL